VEALEHKTMVEAMEHKTMVEARCADRSIWGTKSALFGVNSKLI
jgi:hypothetical protein